LVKEVNIISAFKVLEISLALSESELRWAQGLAPSSYSEIAKFYLGIFYTYSTQDPAYTQNFRYDQY